MKKSNRSSSRPRKSNRPTSVKRNRSVKQPVFYSDTITNTIDGENIYPEDPNQKKPFRWAAGGVASAALLYQAWKLYRQYQIAMAMSGDGITFDHTTSGANPYPPFPLFPPEPVESNPSLPGSTDDPRWFLRFLIPNTPDFGGSVHSDLSPNGRFGRETFLPGSPDWNDMYGSEQGSIDTWWNDVGSHGDPGSVGSFIGSMVGV